MKFSILRIGYGKKERFVIEQIIHKGLMQPVSRPFRTLERAQEEAAKMGIEISKVGTLYEII